jgi:hypothetical protein
MREQLHHTSTSQPNPHQSEQSKTKSHYIGYECVLDKYQHENNILSKKVTDLI